MIKVIFLVVLSILFVVAAAACLRKGDLTGAGLYAVFLILVGVVVDLQVIKQMLKAKEPQP